MTYNTNFTDTQIHQCIYRSTVGEKQYPLDYQTQRLNKKHQADVGVV